MILSIIGQFLEDISINDIRKKSKVLKIKGYYRLKKNEIIQKILENLSIKILQRWWRKKKAYNDICPISLDEIGFPCWSKNTKNGRIYYNLESLVNYLLVRGDFRDPYTRENYTNEELVSIDKLVKQNKLKITKSVRKAKDNIRFYRRQKINDEQIDILTERLRQIFSTIRDKLEDLYNGYEDIRDLTNQLDVSYFPIASECFELLNMRHPRTRDICFLNCNKIIHDINMNCHVINHIKSMVINWLDSEKKKYNQLR
jgi:hypothetical protein